MSNTYILSVCIPTYCRVKYLEKSLVVLKDIVDDDIEIIVSDDQSSDDTKVLVNNFIKDNPKVNIKYSRNKKRLGFDKNVINVINLASGKYCWLLGDDDLPSRSSIKKIKETILNNPTISFIHLNYSRFDSLLNQVTAEKMITGINRDILFNKYTDYYFKVIENACFRHLGTNTITMCTDVVNREMWLSALKHLKKYIGYNFIHSFVIATIIKSGNSVFFISNPQVSYLANNSQVWPNDIWKDYNMVFLNYLISIGYPKLKVLKMRNSQRQFERKEAFIKSKFFGRIYMIMRPYYAKYQSMRSRLLNL